MTSALLSTKYYKERLVPLYYLFTYLTIAFDFIFFAWYAFHGFAQDLKLNEAVTYTAFCVFQILLTCTLNSIASFGFIADIAKIQVLDKQVNNFALSFGFLTAFQVFLP